MDYSDNYRQSADYVTPRRTPLFCGKCGSRAADGATRCAYCGAYLTPPDDQAAYRAAPLSDPGLQQPMVVSQSTPVPAQAGWNQSAPVNVSVTTPVSEPAPVTSVGAWFGWMLLLTFLPLIGTIIMVASTKPGSTKNYAKLLLIFQIIIAVIALIVVLFFWSTFLALVQDAF